MSETVVVKKQDGSETNSRHFMTADGGRSLPMTKNTSDWTLEATFSEQTKNTTLQQYISVLRRFTNSTTGTSVIFLKLDYYTSSNHRILYADGLAYGPELLMTSLGLS
uniref:Uncharacterized protein n=1 Tax=Pyxicephalus adspersus TaxID=30357 RepID=A0AAV2ZNI6_PYXAD|nr:TPA: hypothetical protein GDO54_016389 [Pyxicephalus adspersus]